MRGGEALPEAVFVGVAAMDTVAALPRYPGPDERVVVDDLVRAGGGPAATAAATFARLGLRASFVGAVGGDAEGEAIVAGLRAEGVDVDHVLRDPAATSGASVILVDAARGTRAICNRPPPPLAVPPDGPAAALIRAAAFVHVDQAGWPAVVALAHGALSIDAGNPIPGFGPGPADILAPTLPRLLAMTGARDPDAALDAAIAAGARWVVATRGGEGAVAASVEERCAVPAYPAEIRSTLGAGDVFHGALLAARVRAFPLAEAVAYAAICAALSCRGLDGRSAIPTHDAVMERLPAFMARVARAPGRIPA